jgi:Phospholipase_D-nuclease N-terminal
MIMLAAEYSAGFSIFGIAALLLAVLLGLGAMIFWIWMLVACLTSNRPPLEKLLWFVVIFFFHLLGALLYFLVGRSTPYQSR